VICMDVIKKGEMASTTCGHVFCYDCIKEALKHPPRRCPTCRKTLRQTQIHRLYV
jgi:E3 ubiquitin-protein ligase RNF4